VSAASAIAKVTHRSTPTIILEIRVLHTMSDDQNRDRRQALHGIIDALGQARGSKKDCHSEKLGTPDERQPKKTSRKQE
jgi:hypothetical protein